MNMTEQIDIAGEAVRRRVERKQMTMRRRNPASAQEKGCAVAQNIKIQQHLVYFGIAVAADGNNFIGQRIEQRDDFLGIVALRQRIARPVIKNIAQQQDLIRLVQGIGFKCFFV